MGMLAGRLLGLDLPQTDKRLLTIMETDGCTADGVSAATGCWVGRRTLRIEDYGKVAATFVDTRTRQAVRIVPSPEARQLARQYAPEAHTRWEGQRLGYQRLPDDLLLVWQEVRLVNALEAIIGQHDQPAICQACGEEIINQREVIHEGMVLCHPCAGIAYYQPVALSSAPGLAWFLPQQARGDGWLHGQRGVGSNGRFGNGESN